MYWKALLAATNMDKKEDICTEWIQRTDKLIQVSRIAVLQKETLLMDCLYNSATQVTQVFIYQTFIPHTLFPTDVFIFKFPKPH
jgi:hypothetical protein